jgi:hypothetical protein
MYKCTTCPYEALRGRHGLKQVLAHVDARNRCRLESIKYECPAELSDTAFPRLVTADSLDQAVSYRIRRTDLSGRIMAVTKGLPDSAPIIGGVHKKFSPEHGLVWAAKDTGMSDFPKETNMKGQLGNVNLASGHPIRDIFFSFQNTLDLKEYPDRGPAPHQQNIRYRRVSVYGALDLASSPNHLPNRIAGKTSLNDYMPKLVEYKRKYADDPNALRVLRSGISHIIHQLVYIHYYMYKANIQHGDLHMGNIKIIIDNAGYPVIKAFDFGKSKIARPGNGSTQDLQYFCCRTAVSGFFETFKRNTWRSDDSEKQMKHYPLHRLCMVLLDGIFTTTEINARINAYGEALIKYLRRGSIPPEKTRMAFRGFSDEVVSLFYQPHVWQRILTSSKQ